MKEMFLVRDSHITSVHFMLKLLSLLCLGHPGMQNHMDHNEHAGGVYLCDTSIIIRNYSYRNIFEDESNNINLLKNIIF